jgi:hypothetical protein
MTYAHRSIPPMASRPRHPVGLRPQRNSGYAIARRALPLDLPPNCEISFYMRADAPVNNLQFKLIDASGVTCGGSIVPISNSRQWQLVTIKGQIEFAWGPTRIALNHAPRSSSS